MKLAIGDERKNLHTKELIEYNILCFVHSGTFISLKKPLIPITPCIPSSANNVLDK